MWNFKTPGIPDDLFERTEKVPITKEEVAQYQLRQLYKLNLLEKFLQ